MSVLKLRLLRDEDGAVTVDWVVLTAAIVGLGLACVFILANGTQNVGDTTKTELGKIGDRVATNTVLS